MKKIIIIFGTRPDTIKLAPLINELKKEKKYFQVLTIASAQHRQMLDQVLDVFAIKPDYDLNIMHPNQTLASITKNSIEAMDNIMLKEKPALVIVQGDTTTTFVGALSAFYNQVPVGHVEAGLRTYDKYNPFPEEINRKLTSSMTELHFAPTMTSKKALLKENITDNSIFVTGNTVIDALVYTVKKDFTFSDMMLNRLTKNGKKSILLTMHRRENLGEPMLGAANAIKKLAQKFDDHNFIFPVHLNPKVRNVVKPVLEGIPNVYLIDPLDYLDFVNLMAKCHLILTDSGGIQEEGPHFGIPVLVLRTTTERPEAVKYGTVKLVGLSESKIFGTASKLLTDKAAYDKMANSVNPYGDGMASKRIIQIIKNYFGITPQKVDEFTA